jgi:CheY-like chemotaxis protein
MAERTSWAGKFPDPKERAPTILVVEDEVLVRVVLVDFLQECGFKVFGLSTADEAVDVLKANQIEIDLVVSDVRMPGTMDGFGLARWIKSHRPGVPVILASADSRKTEVAQELCEDLFMSKPFDLDYAVAQIRVLLGARQ